jgi:hypothetical protein
MKYAAVLSISLLSVLAFAQRGSHAPVARAQDSPSYAVRLEPMTGQDWSPLRSPQSSEVLTSPEIQRQILDEFKSEPALSDLLLNVKVDDNSVLLSGEVHSEKEHQLALRIAQSYADAREVVDRIRVNQPM